MSWKIYSLADQKTAQSIADAVTPYLVERGYAVAYTNTDTSKGDFTITIDGVSYSCNLHIFNTSAYPTYLMVNDETDEILIGQTGRTIGTSSMLNYVVCMALLRGTTTKTGEVGLFPIYCGGNSAKDYTNWWGRFIVEDEPIYLQRAVFIKYTSGTGITNVTESFVSGLYWGTALYAPGATCAAGGDTFMCLNGPLFAKL